jgi:hypothetical protein
MGIGSIWWNENWQEKPKYSEKTCRNATFFNTNPICPDLGSNPGRRSGKPATNRLSYGTAFCPVYFTGSIIKTITEVYCIYMFTKFPFFFVNLIKFQ